MRAPVVGLYYAGSLESLAEAARLSASVTHSHPLAIEGAVLVATATALSALGRCPQDVLRGASSCCQSDPFIQRLELAAAWLRSGNESPVKEVKRQLGNGIAATESCVTAIYIALRFAERPFEEMLDFAVECGGDVDTIGAMAGAIWGAANGIAKLPVDKLAKLEQCERLKALAVALHERRS
jgi:poly(ADP-ribose) glycohydrolase ARH3